MKKLLMLGLAALCISFLTLGQTGLASESDISQEQANIQVIQDYYAAYAEGDLEKIKSFFAPDIVWRIPGHHPLAGEKQGPDEVAAFFTQLDKGNFQADPIFFQSQGDYVVDIHRGWSNVEDGGAQVDQLFTLMFKIENGKIVEAQNFLSDQHQADDFFWRVYPLKPLPERLAQ
ncbi:nuclear transport factor 2 family protein [Vasconcelosia minhoensis]|nr:nuclear transport factor 2 family protein [Romeria gracilis]